MPLYTICLLREQRTKFELEEAEVEEEVEEEAEKGEEKVSSKLILKQKHKSTI